MQKEKELAALRADLEEMARDLLLLTRVVGMYPEGHPQLASMVGRLSKWAEGYGEEGLSVGVTGSELIVGGQFFGGRETRLEVLARQEVGRRGEDVRQGGPDVPSSVAVAVDGIAGEGARHEL